MAVNYLDEWDASGVDPQLTQLNVIPLTGHHPLNYLLSANTLHRRNDGRLSSALLKRYNHVYAGGWWCSGVDILTGKADIWGCFKPLQPRQTRDQKKLIKYEHPPQTPTGIFALRVSPEIWRRIAHRYNIEIAPTAVQPNQPDLGFWDWVINHPEVPLCITEGAKKAGTLLSAGYAAIALPGIYSGYRVPKDEWGNRIGPGRLIPQLQKFATAQRQIYLTFDQDTKQNTIKSVQNAIQQLGYLLTQANCLVKVITWNPQLGKGVDDLIVNYNLAEFEQAYQSALDFENWKAHCFNRLTYPVNCQVESRYLPEIKVPDTAKLIGIKSPKGTGKTKLLEHLVKAAIQQQKWVLVISHRTRLVEALCQRFGLKSIKSENETKVITFPSLEEPGYGLCIDSLHPNSLAKFKAENWQDGVVIIDEVEQVLWHGLNSDTCRHHRVAILKSFKKLIQNVLGGNGKVIVADADLSDTSIDYLQTLAHTKQNPFIIKNNWKPSPKEAWNIYNYQGNTPKQLVKDLEQHIAEGGKPFICLSAQKKASQWGTNTLERYLKTQFPRHSILRIDSESLADPTHPAYGCMKHLNQVLKQYDIVLASPVIETGVSIDIKAHFTSVWGIAQGIQSENSVRQALARVRENLPRFFWAATHGFNQISNGSISLKQVLNSGNKLTQLNIRLLQQSDFDTIDDIEIGFQAESLLCWAKMAARFNAGMSQYRTSILSAFVAEGHRIINQDIPEKISDKQTYNCLEKHLQETVKRPTLGELIVAVRDQNYQLERQAIATAETLNYYQYQKLTKKMVKTPLERHCQRKYELKSRYGIPVTSELVEKDDKGWYQKLRIHYFLTIGRTYLEGRDLEIAKQLIEQGQGSIFAPDFNRSQLGVVIGTLDLLGISALLNDSERELKNTDIDLQNMAGIALKDRVAIKSILGIGLAKNATPITVISRLIAQIGYQLKCVRSETKQRKRIRVYTLVQPTDGREQVFQQWLSNEGQHPGQSNSKLNLVQKTDLSCDFIPAESLQLGLKF
ncbi:MAG: plasmid replication protein, CyRepA1 family [Microcoleaceae cyanobacterium]